MRQLGSSKVHLSLNGCLDPYFPSFGEHWKIIERPRLELWHVMLGWHLFYKVADTPSDSDIWACIHALPALRGADKP